MCVMYEHRTRETCFFFDHDFAMRGTCGAVNGVYAFSSCMCVTLVKGNSYVHILRVQRRFGRHKKDLKKKR